MFDINFFNFIFNAIEFFFSEFIIIFSHSSANCDKFRNFSHNLKDSYKLNDVFY